MHACVCGLRFVLLHWVSKFSTAGPDHNIFSLELLVGWELPNTYTDHKILSIKQLRNTLLETLGVPASPPRSTEPRAHHGPEQGAPLCGAGRAAIRSRAPSAWNKAAVSGPSVGSLLSWWQSAADQVSGRADKGRLSVFGAYVDHGIRDLVSDDRDSPQGWGLTVQAAFSKPSARKAVYCPVDRGGVWAPRGKAMSAGTLNSHPAPPTQPGSPCHHQLGAWAWHPVCLFLG